MLGGIFPTSLLRSAPLRLIGVELTCGGFGPAESPSSRPYCSRHAMARRTGHYATGCVAPAQRSCSVRSTIWALAMTACTAQRRRRAFMLPLTLLCLALAVVRLVGHLLLLRVTSDFDEWCYQA